VRYLAAVLVLATLLRAGDDRQVHDVKDPLLQKRINEAIAKGVAYLERVQKDDGHWCYLGESSDALAGRGDSFTGGATALALYALAASGVDKDHPVMRKGLFWVARHPEAYASDGGAATYAISLLVLALTRVDPVAWRRVIHERAQQLLSGQQSDGMWTYTCGPQRTGPPARAPDRDAWRKGIGGGYLPDHSNTQLAVLALWAAYSLADFPVPEKVWEKERKHFLKKQLEDGGWSYRMIHRESTDTMTAAGIVSLVYAFAALDGEPAALERARNHPAIRKALARLPLKGRRGRGMGDGAWENYYWTYSVERVGTVLALEPERWYVPGARFLVEHQDEQGHWPRRNTPAGRFEPGFGIRPAREAERVEPDYTYTTSLALLFLTAATLPPVRGAVTERRETPPPVLTQKEEFPDPSTPEGLERAFAFYLAYKPAAREAVRARFGAAGPAALRLFAGRLRAPDLATRDAAWELLGALLEKPLLFDPRAAEEERTIMLAPIDGYLAARGDRLAWNPGSGRFEEK